MLALCLEARQSRADGAMVEAMAALPTPRSRRYRWFLAGATVLGSFLADAPVLAQQPPQPPSSPTAPPGATTPPAIAPPPEDGQPGYGPPPGYYWAPPQGYSLPPGYYYLPPMDEREQKKQEALMKRDWPMRSLGMVIGGSVLTAGGAVGIGISALMVFQGISVSGSQCSDCTINGKGALAAFVLGGVGLGVGIPLIVIGRKRVPPKSAPVASMHVGPAGGVFALAF